VTTEAGCTLDSQFVADVTIPDGTIVDLGQSFIKTWRVRNSGTCDWDAGFELAFVSGEQMDGPASVSLPGVAAGDEVDISVDLAAPTAYGTHKGTWRLRADDGAPFGTNLTVIISVPTPVTETPLSTAVHTLAPTAAAPAPTTVPVKPLPSTAPYTERVAKEATFAGGVHKTLTVECPTGSVVVGGGFSGGPDIVFHASKMSSQNGWVIDATNTSTADGTVRVYAVCLHNVPGASSTRVHTSIKVAAGDVEGTKAECPSGSILTGGGWSTAEPNMRIYHSAKVGPNMWFVFARNEGSLDQTIGINAVCLTGSGGIIHQNHAKTSVPAGGTGQVEVTCPAGTIMTSGGFSYTAKYGLPSVHINSGPWGEAPDAEWRVYAANPDTTSQDLTGIAFCIEFP
jgi:hypothetical protein